MGCVVRARSEIVKSWKGLGHMQQKTRSIASIGSVVLIAWIASTASIMICRMGQHWLRVALPGVKWSMAKHGNRPTAGLHICCTQFAHNRSCILHPVWWGFWSWLEPHHACMIRLHLARSMRKIPRHRPASKGQEPCARTCLYLQCANVSSQQQ